MRKQGGERIVWTHAQSPRNRLQGRLRPAGEGKRPAQAAVRQREVRVQVDGAPKGRDRLLLLAAQRIQDLKGDGRFKYVGIYKDYGNSAGQEFEHPTSQLTATTFVPRRVLYELRAAREYFQSKERCVFCDIISQEMRQDLRVIELRGDFIALCPYAPRVPYESWIMPRTHEAAFERFGLNRPGTMRDLGALLRRTLQRIRTITEDFHLVLHTSPNSLHRSVDLGYWKTIDEDYHWHIEIMPILAKKAKSYTFKEVYYSPLSSETAVKALRDARIEP